MVLVDVSGGGVAFALFITLVIEIIAGLIGYEFFKESIVSVVIFQAIAGVLMMFLFPVLAAGLG